MRRAICSLLAAWACFTIGCEQEVSTSQPAAPECKTAAKKEFDLTVEIPVTPGFKGVSYRAAVPGFELMGAKLLEKSDKTWVMIGAKFTSQKIKSVAMRVELLNRVGGRPRFQTTHVEKLGPVGNAGDDTIGVKADWKWERRRSIWLDCPKQADKAKAIRISIILEHGDQSPHKFRKDHQAMVLRTRP